MFTRTCYAKIVRTFVSVIRARLTLVDRRLAANTGQIIAGERGAFRVGRARDISYCRTGSAYAGLEGTKRTIQRARIAIIGQKLAAVCCIARVVGARVLIIADQRRTRLATGQKIADFSTGADIIVTAEPIIRHVRTGIGRLVATIDGTGDQVIAIRFRTGLAPDGWIAHLFTVAVQIVGA